MLLSRLLTACYLRRCTTLVADVVTTMKEASRTMSTRHLPEGTKRTVLWWRAAGPLAVVLVVVAVSLAACGGSPSNGVANLGSTATTSLSSAAQNAAADAVRYANCMRSNGVTDFPDPSSNGRPQSLNQIDPNSATFQTAYTACRKYAANGQGGPPPRHPPNCASRSRSPSACASTGSRSSRTRSRPLRGRTFRWAGGVLSPQQHDRLPVALTGVQAGSQGLRSAASLGHTVAFSARQASQRTVP